MRHLLLYKIQRDKLVKYLVEEIGISKVTIGKILGIQRAGVTLQWPDLKKKLKGGE